MLEIPAVESGNGLGSPPCSCRPDDLHVVEDLELPSGDPQYLQELARHRHWGHSVLIVDVKEFPENIRSAAQELKTITLIPALGLNVHSLLKHQTLLLTLDTVTFLEQRLLWHNRRFSPLYSFSKPYRDFPEPPLGG
ncbi:39S ribosomal protein L4, mitochondrial [Empidonax traillii]|uniref:39S ribosomal protein L4, mitochondrial n=1 Tax=Empidonax traillii TaxID=164674 RepID=UPI000FFCEF86|nr:39S ribosomal protein L4, mitochondrial [Empidonax traillii]